MRLQGAGEGLTSLEVRTAPEDTCEATDRVVNQMTESAAKVAPGIEFGIVLHFQKDRGDKTTAGSPAAHGRGSNADPARPVDPQHVDLNPTGYRYASYYDKAMKQAQAWAQAIRQRPEILRTLRGVDVCNDERAVPNWVFIQLFEVVIQASREVAGPPLGRTVHVGEDFVHPFSGLRLVAEVIRFFNLRAGDRIGHGLALGIDMVEWTARAGRMALRREDRLFDLAWEWAWCSGRRTGGLNRLPYLEREIRRLAKVVFHRTIGPEEIMYLAADLHNPCRLASVGFPDGQLTVPMDRWNQFGDNRLRLLHHYLTDGPTFLRGQEAEWFHLVDEGKLLANLQREVRLEVGRRGIAVEVNPSSNLLIGDFGDLRRHPFWRLSSPPRAAADTPPVVVCVGSDDPITFVSDIRQEFQLVYDALLSGGLSADDAMQFVDRLRVNGLKVRFTLPVVSSGMNRGRDVLPASL
jgi:hypothetical protein